jgi:GT2 family glycosyltransferase
MVNWNGWRDTIECLESLFRMEFPDFKVVVCDNASSDDSLSRIEEWAAGTRRAECGNQALESLVNPAVSKPVACVRLNSLDPRDDFRGDSDAALILIQTGKNLGFAGGSNVGIRWALADAECNYVWLLNNDTVVEPQALSAMVAHMDDQNLGMCGSLCLFYHKPEEIQALGGPAINKWTGSVFATRGLRLEQAKDHSGRHRMDYVFGASWLISRACFETVGLLDESYFLYCEEADLAMRTRGRYQMGYTIESRVYHKAGASAGNSRNRSKRSITAERFGVRSRILLARRFYRPYLPTVVLAVVLGGCYRLIRGPRRNGVVALKALWEGLLAPLNEPPQISHQAS